MQIKIKKIYNKKCIKHLRDKFSKYLQDLLVENYKTLMTEIKEDLYKKERDTMTMDGKAHCCKGISYTQIDLKSQCNFNLKSEQVIL